MGRIWSYWFFVILLILGIIFFSIAIAKAAEYQCHIPTNTSHTGYTKLRGMSFKRSLTNEFPSIRGTSFSVSPTLTGGR
jgi:hypothetical protein